MRCTNTTISVVRGEHTGSNVMSLFGWMRGHWGRAGLSLYPAWTVHLVRYLEIRSSALSTRELLGISVVVGGQWMWHEMEKKGQDIDWLVMRLLNGTLTCGTERLYDQKGAPGISGSGIFLCCTKAQHMPCTNLYKKPKTVHSYQGNVLGLVAIHTIILAMCCFLWDHFHVTQGLLWYQCCSKTIRLASLLCQDWSFVGQLHCVLRMIKLDQIIKATSSTCLPTKIGTDYGGKSPYWSS